jgi:hypothetical protein
VIGLRGTPGHGSLAEWGVTYRELPLAPTGAVDWDALATAIIPGKTKVAHVQRSCGYALRPTLSIEEIERIVKIVKAQVGWGSACRCGWFGCAKRWLLLLRPQRRQRGGSQNRRASINRLHPSIHPSPPQKKYRTPTSSSSSTTATASSQTRASPPRWAPTWRWAPSSKTAAARSRRAAATWRGARI